MERNSIPANALAADANFEEARQMRDDLRHPSGTENQI
jgi:hypothetical protein